MSRHTQDMQLLNTTVKQCTAVSSNHQERDGSLYCAGWLTFTTVIPNHSIILVFGREVEYEFLLYTHEMVEGLCVLCIGRRFALTSRLTNMVQSGFRWLRFPKITITYHVDSWRRPEPKERNVP